ncbi:MAG: AraC family transcriptional regulator [Glaciihabitans sp.]|nr:AraC family transcriptional regulator [Glaciihabitans sp.]
MTDETAVAQSLDRSAETVRRHIHHPQRATQLGLQLSRVSEPTALMYTRYEPCISFVLHGRKRSIVGDHDQRWGRENFLVTPVDLPVIAGVVETGELGDFISVNWRLDPAVVAEVAAQLPRASRPEPTNRLGEVTPQLADTVERLFRLLDAPEEIAVLAPLISRELVLRLLQTDQAPRLLAAAQSANAGLVNAAIGALTTALAEPWTIDRLAGTLGTSPATLSRKFRQLTEMPPMQYLKRLRLGEARRRMLVEGDSAAQAAGAVGYISASHFSRDYRAAYEVSPAADAADWRRRMRSAA